MSQEANGNVDLTRQRHIHGTHALSTSVTRQSVRLCRGRADRRRLLLLRAPLLQQALKAPAQLPEALKTGVYHIQRFIFGTGYPLLHLALIS